MNTMQMLEVWWIFGYTPYYPGFLKPLAASFMAAASSRYLYGLLGWPAPVGIPVCALFFLVIYILSLVLLGLPPEDRLFIREFRERKRSGAP
jgi:hypothetical protein